MKLDEKYKTLYSDYYKEGSSGDLSIKRQITADETAAHFLSFFKQPKFTSLVDIGAGDGSTLLSLARLNIAEEFAAFEISQSGLDEIRAQNIKNLNKAELFDGYHLSIEPDFYDVGIAAHVLEHVEHERLFLKEFSRVSRVCYLEVPLENTLNITKAIQSGEKYGHINFYNPETLLSLIKSSDLILLKHQIFQHSYAYERLIGGRLRGFIKYVIKKIALTVSPKIATILFAYTAGVLFTTSENFDYAKNKV
jgi:2-polyprenyl-3-methyl-5-hydroxy-6-metoxy-1,4-benzoquinol methylase